MSKIQVNVTSKVNRDGIRREQYNGREHIVVSSFSLKEDSIMNDIFYSKREIDANYKKLEGTYAPFGHPMKDGKFISAREPEALNTSYFGCWNRNVTKVGNRVHIEKWIDVEVANRHDDGKEVIKRIEALEKGESDDPIHTSVAVFLEKVPVTNSSLPYKFEARIEDFDHDAVLPFGVPGANTPDDGVGMMVNVDQAITLMGNDGVLTGETYREKESRLRIAAQDRFKASEDEYVYIEDFTDEQVIVYRGNIGAEVYGYKSEGGRIVFEDTGTAVVIKQSWITKNPIVNKLLQTFGLFDVKSQQQKPVTTNMEGAMPITAEEKADLVKTIGESVSGLLAPLAAEVKAIQANQVEIKDAQAKLASDLTANARAEEAEKRVAIAAVHGEVVANALQGEALEAMHKGLGKAAPIVNGKNGEDKQNFAEVPE